MDKDSSEAQESRPLERAHAQKRLARGLDDVTHLFLSESRAADVTPGGVVRDSSAGTPHPTQAGPAFVGMFHPLPSLSQDLLASLLNDHAGELEESLRIIDSNVPCEPHGSIDLLAVDAAGRFVIIDLDVSAGDGLLLRGICHFDWFTRNVPVLRRMFRGQVIDFSSNARLFLVAPDYSDSLRCIVRWIENPRISCFRYRALAAKDGVGVFLERT